MAMKYPGFGPSVVERPPAGRAVETGTRNSNAALQLRISPVHAVVVERPEQSAGHACPDFFSRGNRSALEPAFVAPTVFVVETLASVGCKRHQGRQPGDPTPLP